MARYVREPELVEGGQCLRVFLTPYEWRHAANVGDLRAVAAWSLKDAKHYQNEKTKRDSRDAHIFGALGECGTARGLNLYWSACIWPDGDPRRYRDVADVGTNVEVKAVRRRGNPARLRKEQTGRRFFFVQAYPEPPHYSSVLLLGWGIYDRLYSLGQDVADTDGDKDCDPKYLKPMADALRKIGGKNVAGT